MNTEEYEQQVEYIKNTYPNKKINIKGVGVKDIDTISNYEDLSGIIKEYKIRCAGCDKSIKPHWFVVLHNRSAKLKEPVDILFFCCKDCLVKWGEDRAKKADYPVIIK